MAEPVKIRVDLAAGIVEVEADASNIDAIFDRLDAFIPRLSEAYGRPTRENGSASTIGGAASSASNLDRPTADAPANNTEQKVDTRKTKKGSKGKEVYSAVELGLTEGQRQDLRDFYASKQPQSQHEQIAVLMDWLKREANKSTASWNDIFTAFRTVNVKSPAKISSVLGNMVGLSWVKNVGEGQYALIHVGEDYVKFDLPKPAKKAK
jgi:hypothetical protein